MCRPKRISGVEKRTVNLCSVGGWCPHPPQFSQQKHIFTFHVEIFATRYILFFVFRNWGLEASQFVPTHPIFVLENVTCDLKCRNSESTILGGWIGALFTFLLFAFENIFQGERGKILVVGIIHHSFVTAFAIVTPAGGSNNGALFPFRDPAQLFLSELDIYQCFIFSLQRTLSLLEVRSNEIFPNGCD